jgi:hypothetical protein
MRFICAARIRPGRSGIAGWPRTAAGRSTCCPGTGWRCAVALDGVAALDTDERLQRVGLSGPTPLRAEWPRYVEGRSRPPPRGRQPRAVRVSRARRASIEPSGPPQTMDHAPAASRSVITRHSPRFVGGRCVLAPRLLPRRSAATSPTHRSQPTGSGPRLAHDGIGRPHREPIDVEKDRNVALRRAYDARLRPPSDSPARARPRWRRPTTPARPARRSRRHVRGCAESIRRAGNTPTGWWNSPSSSSD